MPYAPILNRLNQNSLGNAPLLYDYTGDPIPLPPNYLSLPQKPCRCALDFIPIAKITFTHMTSLLPPVKCKYLVFSMLTNLTRGRLVLGYLIAVAHYSFTRTPSTSGIHIYLVQEILCFWLGWYLFLPSIWTLAMYPTPGLTSYNHRR